MNSPVTIPVLIDTDPGIDDALAILLALASPEISIEAITVVAGNCSARQGVINTLSILELANAPHIPVALGAEIPLVKPLLLAPETHGPQGLGYATLPEPSRQPHPAPAVNLIIETARRFQGELVIVSLGAMTNLALAIRLEPNLIHWIKHIYIMGGAILHPGNTTPAAEFNVYYDPHAAHIVFHSGIPLTLGPLDVTYKILLTQTHVDGYLASGSPVGRLIADATRFYMEFHESYQNIHGCIINDPLVLGMVYRPGLVQTLPLHVEVDINSGPSLGATVADFFDIEHKRPNMEVGQTVDAAAFLNLFDARMLSLCSSVPSKSS